MFISLFSLCMFTLKFVGIIMHFIFFFCLNILFIHNAWLIWTKINKIFFFILHNLTIFVYQVALFQVLFYFTCLLWSQNIFFINIIGYHFYNLYHILTWELFFPTIIASPSTTSIVRILPLSFPVHSDKPKMFNRSNFKWWQHKILIYVLTLNFV
jgi:hypothetical protein